MLRLYDCPAGPTPTSSIPAVLPPYDEWRDRSRTYANWRRLNDSGCGGVRDELASRCRMHAVTSALQRLGSDALGQSDDRLAVQQTRVDLAGGGERETLDPGPDRRGARLVAERMNRLDQGSTLDGP